MKTVRSNRAMSSAEALEEDRATPLKCVETWTDIETQSAQFPPAVRGQNNMERVQ